jgi:hypothetical protein
MDLKSLVLGRRLANREMPAQKIGVLAASPGRRGPPAWSRRD